MQDDLVELAASTASLLDDNYVIGNVIGCGGMGVVYSATQAALGRRVAIKVPRAELATNPFVIRRFKTEARAGGRLAHRNIARVIDFGGRDGAPFLVMEYVAGVPLETLVSEQGPMTTAVATEIVTQILAALHEAHTAGVIHADIKSGNVLVETLPDGALLARVIDFGLARFSDESSVDDDMLVTGTPDYLAPELVGGGRPTVASDIYAAGIILYELLTGTTPFGGTQAEILTSQLDDLVHRPSSRAPDQGISRAVEMVVMRALSKDPARRFTCAAEFSVALRAALPVEQSRTPRFPRGTIKPASVEPAHERIRCVLADAIACGDGDAIVAAYLDLVGVLVGDHQLAAAAGELEHGLVLLRRSTVATTACAATWRLQLCLASLYSGLGDQPRARIAARLGHELAVGAASEIGQQRATELLDRLAGTRAYSAAAVSESPS